MRAYTQTAIRTGIIAGMAISVTMMTVVTFGLLNRSAGANTTVTGPRDCDSNAVIYCGALSTDELQQKYEENAPKDIPQIYQHFGISASDVESLGTKTTVGTVRADGTVWVDGTLIGVNAKTSGRNKTPNSVAIPGTNAYKRPPSDSFATPSTEIKIFIGYEGDTPAFAIMSSCGNPMTWDKPQLDVEKTVSKDGVSWKDFETFSDGDTVSFRVQIYETTGYVDVQGVTLVDDLPEGYSFMSGSLTLDGVTQPDPTASQPITIGSVQKGATVTAVYKATINLVGKECGSNTLTNTAVVNGMHVGEVRDSASAQVQKDCEAVIACGSLTHSALPAQPKPGDIITFTLTEDTLENTTVSAYIFKVNNVVSQQGASNTFAFSIPEFGTYAVEGVIRTPDGDSPSTPDCIVTVTAEETPPPPTPPTTPPPVTPQTLVACTGLSGPAELKVAERGTYIASTTNDDAVAFYTFRVNGIVTGANGNTFNYMSTAAGQHTITATITPKDDAEIDPNGSAVCSTTVTVTQEVIASCKSLQASRNSITLGNSVTFTAEAEMSGTTVEDYIFFVDDSEQQRSSSSTFVLTPTEAGSFDVMVRILFANGDVRTSMNCGVTITVVNDSVETVTSCDRLRGRVSLNDGDTATYTASATASGTTVERYVFELNGDVVQRTADNEYTLDAIDGSHTLRVSVMFVNGDVKTSDSCVLSINVDTEEEPDEPEVLVDVCRGGVVVRNIKESDRRATDTDAPCQLKGVSTVIVCRDDQEISINVDYRLSTDTDAPCPEEKDDAVDRLPNTGGSADTVAGLATALAGAGAMGYRKYSLRRQ